MGLIISLALSVLAIGSIIYIIKSELEKINKDVNHKFSDQNNFNRKIDELNQETETLIDEIEKSQT